MKVSELMTRDVQSCTMDDTLERAAQIMWNCDCGCVPVVDGLGRVVAMLTDRDICMAALTQGRTLDAMTVGSAACTSLVCVRPNASIEDAEEMMQENQVRRVPVVDGDGSLVGLLSFNNIARRVQTESARSDGLSADTIAMTIAAISEPHGEHHAHALR
jgi:CBS domain-containing protein